MLTYYLTMVMLTYYLTMERLTETISPWKGRVAMYLTMARLTETISPWKGWLKLSHHRKVDQNYLTMERLTETISPWKGWLSPLGIFCSSQKWSRFSGTHPAQHFILLLLSFASPPPFSQGQRNNRRHRTL